MGHVRLVCVAMSMCFSSWVDTGVLGELVNLLVAGRCCDLRLFRANGRTNQPFMFQCSSAQLKRS